MNAKQLTLLLCLSLALSSCLGKTGKAETDKVELPVEETQPPVTPTEEEETPQDVPEEVSFNGVYHFTPTSSVMDCPQLKDFEKKEQTYEDTQNPTDQITCKTGETKTELSCIYKDLVGNESDKTLVGKITPIENTTDSVHFTLSPDEASQKKFQTEYTESEQAIEGEDLSFNLELKGEFDLKKSSQAQIHMKISFKPSADDETVECSLINQYTLEKKPETKVQPTVCTAKGWCGTKA